MVPFFSIIRFFQIVLNNINFMKIKILKPKHQNFNSILNGLHFVEFIQNIPLVVDEKMSQRGCCCVFSPNRWNFKIEGRFVVHLGIMF
jgi:hypothetical protein